MKQAELLKDIDDFESHYQYDSTYMRELLEHSPAGFEKFNNFMPLASHREQLEPEVFWVAKIAAMQVEDCGACLQLNVRMAIEAGISRQLVEGSLKGGKGLSAELKDIYDFATGVAGNTLDDVELVGRIETHFDKGALLELGLCIATAKIFPTIKRALGYTESCSLMEIEV